MMAGAIRFLILAFLVALAFRLALRLLRAFKGGLTVDQLNELKARQALVLDVRTRAEFGGGHVAGSLNIPLDELPRRLDELDRTRPILVCCASGIRSAQAQRLLQSSGFPEVHNAGPWQNAR